MQLQENNTLNGTISMISLPGVNELHYHSNAVASKGKVEHCDCNRQGYFIGIMSYSSGTSIGVSQLTFGTVGGTLHTLFPIQSVSKRT